MIILPRFSVFMVRIQCILYLFFSGISSQTTTSFPIFSGEERYKNLEGCCEDDPIPPPPIPPKPPKCALKTPPKCAQSWDLSKCLGSFQTFSHNFWLIFQTIHFDESTKINFIIYFNFI